MIKIILLNICVGFFMYFYMDNLANFPIYLFWVFLLVIFAEVICKQNSLGKDLNKLTYLSFLYFSIVGLVVVNIYRASYGLDFGPSTDDSRFFERIAELTVGNTPARFTLYELSLSYYCRFIRSFFFEPRLLDLLPFNWFVSALVVRYSHLLAINISGRKLGIWLTFIAVVGNYRFLDVGVHLYRDSLLLLCILWSLIFSFQKRYVLASLLVLPVGLIRGGNGILLAISIGLIFLGISINGRIKKYIVAFLLAIIILPICYYNQQAIIFNATSFVSYSDKQLLYEDIGEVITARKSIQVDDKVQKGWMYDLIYRSPLAYPIRPIFTLFLPLSFAEPFVWKNVAVDGFRERLVYMLNIEGIANWLTIPLWLVLGPLFFWGLKDGWKLGEKQKTFIIVFLLWIFVISVVSFQGRHSTAFIILIPSVISLTNIDRLKSNRNLVFGFAFLIFFFNLFRMSKFI